MLIFIIVVIVIVVSIAAITSENNNKSFNDNSNTLKKKKKTEMMSDMYKDISRADTGSAPTGFKIFMKNIGINVFNDINKNMKYLIIFLLNEISLNPSTIFNGPPPFNKGG